MSASEPILIAGGGIGGLALALALAKRGERAIVLERQEAFAPAGAGIQVGPNGMRALQALGLADALRPFAGVPEAIVVRAGSSGGILARLPLGTWIANRHGAPYWVAHRGDLHRVLVEAATREPRITMRTGFYVASITQSATSVTVANVDGNMVAGGAAIGADGIWSNVRSLVAPEATPRFAGATATRTVIPISRAGALAMPAVGLWLSPHAHVVHYPVRGGSEIAVVVIAREDWQDDQWDAEANGAALLTQLSGFHSSLFTALRDAPPWRKWALYTLPQLPSWTNGRIALLGDAAHPMLPYLAQGGALAVEDALVLAACLSGSNDVPRALGTYASLRRQRACRVQAASVRQGRIYRLAPPLSYARDTVFRLLPPAQFMARLDWLYGWHPPSTHDARCA